MNNLEKGIAIENFVAKELKKSTKFNIEQNHTWGVDIEMITPIGNLNIEVKSANYFVKNGKRGIRKGTFSFYPNNLERPDFFAFVVCNDLGKNKTYWVRGDVIRKHFERRVVKTKLTLGIPTLLQSIKKIDFSEVVNF